MITEEQPKAQPIYEEDEPCVYLPGMEARMRYRIMASCPAKLYQDLLIRGWRRFGRVFFRPDCRSCTECKSLRVDLAAFAPSRSMRRTLARNRDLRVMVAEPTVSHEHLDLYRRYHRDMAERRGWEERETTLEDYYDTFVNGAGTFGHQLLFFLDEALVAVALVDVLPQAMSSVYCFYDPALRQRGLGVYSVLRQVDWARQRGIPYLYLGFRVAGNPSMLYKARYRPHQLLCGRPEQAEDPVWEPGAALV